MIFENHIYLYFLPAALLPALIYYIFRKKPERLVFGSVYLLRSIAEDVRKKTRLKDIILLIIRTIFFILLVLFFARPYTGKNQAFDPGKRTVTAVCLDSSPSMNDGMSGRNKFSKACSMLTSTVLSSNRNDLFYIFTSDPGVKFRGGRSDAVKFISGLNVYGAERPLSGFLSAADSVLSGHADSNRMILLLTDGRTVSVPDEKTTEVFTKAVLFGGTGNENISIDSAKISDGGSAVFYLSLNGRETVFDIFSDGKKIYTEKIAPGNKSPENISADILTASLSGTLVHALLKDGFNPEDDEYFLAVTGQKKRKVLICGDQDSEAVKSSRALIGSDRNSLLQAETVPFGSLLTKKFKEYDAVFITELPAAGSYLASALNGYVSEGGSLFITAGEVLNLNDYSSNLRPVLGLPRIEGYLKPAGSHFAAAVADPEHPVFRKVFGEDFKGLNSFEIYEMYRFREVQGKVLVRAQDDPYLMEFRRGRGKIFLLASGLSEKSSNLIKNGIAVPLILNSLNYLAGSLNSGIYDHKVGEKIVSDQTVAIIPENDVFRPDRFELSNSFVLNRAGFFNITDAEGNTVRTIGVNNCREDRTDLSEDIRRIFSETVKAEDLPEGSGLVSFSGRSLSTLIIISILILAAADIIIVRKM